MIERNGIVELLKKVNNLCLSRGNFVPFISQGVQVGIVTEEVCKVLLRYPHVFHVTDAYVSFSPMLEGFHQCSQALNGVLLEFRATLEFGCLKGWRDECYEISSSYGTKPFFQIERSAAPILGIRKYGIQINGYVNHSQQGLCLWFQKRAKTKPTYPGQIDNFVGGGLTEGRGVLETAIKEGEEEAGLEPHLCKNLLPTGTISYLHQSERGIHPLTEFVFDLELPESWLPANTDGEVDEWILCPVTKVFDVLFSKDLKLTSSPVIVDFLVRHGILNIENEPDLPIISELLHTPLHMLNSVGI